MKLGEEGNMNVMWLLLDLGDDEMQKHFDQARRRDQSEATHRVD